MKEISADDLTDFLALSLRLLHLKSNAWVQILAYEMACRGIEPTICAGLVEFESVVRPHDWVTVNGEYWDFRLQLIYGNHAPFGRITDGVIYHVTQIVPMVSERVIELLCERDLGKWDELIEKFTIRHLLTTKHENFNVTH
jgi:hypothetical protein